MKIADNPFYIGVFKTGEIKMRNTAEALSSFICLAGEHCDLRILDPKRSEVLNTFGIWIDKCADKEFLAELKKVLVPKQKALTKELGFPECP